jgi:hypothetical protein
MIVLVASSCDGSSGANKKTDYSSSVGRAHSVSLVMGSWYKGRGTLHFVKPGCGLTRGTSVAGVLSTMALPKCSFFASFA